MRQPRTIAQHQSDQSTFASESRHRQQTLAQAVAPGAQALGNRLALAGLDRTRRTDAFGQQPSLVIESVWIDQAMGTLEIHRQPPPLAGLYRWAAMPGQTQPARQRAAPGNRVAQLETHHAIPVFRQPDQLS